MLVDTPHWATFEFDTWIWTVFSRVYEEAELESVEPSESELESVESSESDSFYYDEW